MNRRIALMIAIALMLGSVGALAGNGTQQRHRRQSKDGTGENCAVHAVGVVRPATADGRCKGKGNGNGNRHRACGSGGNGNRQQKRDGSCAQ